MRTKNTTYTLNISKQRSNSIWKSSKTNVQNMHGEYAWLPQKNERNISLKIRFAVFIKGELCRACSIFTEIVIANSREHYSNQP